MVNNNIIYTHEQSYKPSAYGRDLNSTAGGSGNTVSRMAVDGEQERERKH